MTHVQSCCFADIKKKKKKKKHFIWVSMYLAWKY